ncbi:MAG: hypothetical protein QXM89_03915 [Candidatus Bathyarchaeia archaeon]
MKHCEAEVLSKCQGELLFRRTIIFVDKPYREYRCSKCDKWIYIPDTSNTGDKFCFETQVRI